MSLEEVLIAPQPAAGHQQRVTLTWLIPLPKVVPASASPHSISEELHGVEVPQPHQAAGPGQAVAALAVIITLENVTCHLP